MSDEDFLAPAQFEPAQDDQPQAEPAPQPEPQRPETTVPLAALQSERAENRSLKSQIPVLQQKIDQLTEIVQRATAPRPEPIDPVADPERFSAMMQSQIAAVASNTRAEMSERFARDKYGDDAVEEAFSAAQTAGVVDQFRGQKDPWNELVKWHKSAKVAQEIGNDPDAYKARLKAEIMQELQSAGQVGASVKPPAAPTLAGQANLAARTDPAWSGPAPLDDILGTKGGSF